MLLCCRGADLLEPGGGGREEEEEEEEEEDVTQHLKHTILSVHIVLFMCPGHWQSYYILLYITYTVIIILHILLYITYTKKDV